MDFKSSVTKSMRELTKSFKSPTRNNSSSSQSSQDNFSHLSLEKINRYYKSILREPYDERIVFRPILAEKIMPKKPIPSLYSNQRYIMVTNKRLYTLDPKKLDKGELDKDKVIVNTIDIDYLNHLIFFPKDTLDAYDSINQHWDIKKLAKDFDQRLKNKKVEVIIGFLQRKQFNEKDIALSTNFLVVLQLIHAFYLAMNYDQHQKIVREMKEMQSMVENQRESNLTGEDRFMMLQNYQPRDRGSSIAETYQELPIFIVNQEASQKQLELKQFYRTEDSPADIQIKGENQILPRLDIKYFLEMFWQLDPNSQPPAVKYEQELLQLENERQEKLKKEQEQQKEINYYDQSENQSMRMSSCDKMIMGSIYGGDVDVKHGQISSLSFFKVEVFQFEGQSNFRQYFTFDRSLSHNNNHYTMTNAFEDRKYKLFNPKIFDPPKHFIKYKNGAHWVVATKIMAQKYLNAMNDIEIQEEVKMKQDLLDKMCLKEALPEKSEPHIFLTEGTVGRDESPINKAHSDSNKDFKIYFGYLIPNKISLIQMSPKYLRTQIQMKHGLMILYQFIQTVINLHKHGLGFGHVDFQNMFIGLNRYKPSEGLKFSSNGEEITSFTRDFLFMDPNLQQMFNSKSRDINQQMFVSQTTKQSQEEFIMEKLDTQLTQQYLNVYFPEESARLQQVHSAEKSSESIVNDNLQAFKNNPQFRNMRSDSDCKKEIRGMFYGNQDSVKIVKTDYQTMQSDKMDQPYNFMHEEKMGIKLAPRQQRELTDARSIAILTTTMAHYCKKICEFNNPGSSNNSNGSQTSRNFNGKGENFSLLKSSTQNFDTVTLSNSNGSMSYRPATAQSNHQRCYELLREPEEELREQFCDQIIEKLSEVRHLVSQVVLEEDDDEIRQSASFEAYRNSNSQKRISGNSGSQQRTSSGKRISENQPEYPMYIDKSFMKILYACRQLCVQYLKIFDDVNYWKNIVNQIEKGLKTERKNQQMASAVDLRKTEVDTPSKLKPMMTMSPQNIVTTPSQLSNKKRVNQSQVVDGSFLKGLHSQPDFLKGFDPTQSVVSFSKVFQDSQHNSPHNSPRRQSIRSEYTNYSEYTDMLHSNLRNNQVTSSLMSIPENLENNSELKKFHNEFMSQLDIKEKTSDEYIKPRERNDTFDTNPIIFGSIKSKAELEETVHNKIYQKSQFMTDQKCQSQVFDLQNESPQSNQIDHQLIDFDGVRIGSMGNINHNRRQSTQICRKSDDSHPSPRQEKSDEEQEQDEMEENQAAGFVMPSNMSFNREKMSIKVPKNLQNPEQDKIIFETNENESDQTPEKTYDRSKFMTFNKEQQEEDKKFNPQQFISMNEVEAEEKLREIQKSLLKPTPDPIQNPKPSLDSSTAESAPDFGKDNKKGAPKLDDIESMEPSKIGNIVSTPNFSNKTQPQPQQQLIDSDNKSNDIVENNEQ